MIVAYYPGAGGNRYLQFLQNKEFSSLGVYYTVGADAPIIDLYNEQK
jgi:hypothetical protein